MLHRASDLDRFFSQMGKGWQWVSTCREVVDWIHLAQVRDLWRAVVNTVMKKAGNFLTSWVTVSFSTRTLLHGVRYRSFCIGVSFNVSSKVCMSFKQYIIDLLHNILLKYSMTGHKASVQLKYSSVFTTTTAELPPAYSPSDIFSLLAFAHRLLWIFFHMFFLPSLFSHEEMCFWTGSQTVFVFPPPFFYSFVVPSDAEVCQENWIFWLRDKWEWENQYLGSVWVFSWFGAKPQKSSLKYRFWLALHRFSY
jgi:hypothetical protein